MIHFNEKAMCSASANSFNNLNTKEEGYNESFILEEDNYDEDIENEDFESLSAVSPPVFCEIKQEDTDLKEAPLENNIIGAKKSYKCSVCDSSFERIGLLTRHKESVHEKKRPHKCPLCDSHFAQIGGMKLHIETVHEKKRPWKCDRCESTFTQKVGLKSHIEHVHEGKKSFLCTICGTDFCDKQALKRHNGRFHEGKNLKMCLICDASFEMRKDLKDHIRTVHEGKSHKCPFCDALYSKSQGISCYFLHF